MSNVPTDTGMEPLQPVTDPDPSESVTKEQKDLAKVGNSPEWGIIKEYLEARIDMYKNGLFGENLAGADASIIGQRFLAAQAVIGEFQRLQDEIEQTTKNVNAIANKK